jgi:hypothetical protein
MMIPASSQGKWRSHYAEDGAVLTASLFANRHTNGRNAWRFV